MNLQELVAREHVRDVINRYCTEADQARLDGVAALFTPDATYEFGDRHYRGRDGIREMFAESGRRAAAAGFTSRVQHCVTTSTIDVDGSTAQGTTYVTVLANSGVDHWGRYRDQFLCEGAEWLISRREFTLLGAVPAGIGEVLR